MTEEVKLNEPSEQWVAEKKKKYGKIFRMVIAGEVYVYRYLTRSEFKNIQKDILPQVPAQGQTLAPEMQSELEDRVTKMCVLWPEKYEEYENVPANVPTILAQLISDASGNIEEPPTEL